MDKKIVPYELLVRWDHDGHLSGAHYQFRTVITDEGAIVADRISDAVPVAVGDSDGFPLADILTPEQLAPMVAIGVQMERAAAAEAAQAAAEAQRDEALRTVQEMLVQYTAAKP